MNQKTENRYQIITNNNRRRILVINDVVDVDRKADLAFEDFDAVFINVIDNLMDRIMLAIRLASPLLSEKCRFKPCYVTKRLTGWLGKAEVIVDGYASQPTDSNMAQGIEEIYANMRRINFLLGTEPVVSHAEEIFRLCRYAISRGQYTFSSHPTPGLSSGYMSLYYYTLWFEGQENQQLEERDFFHAQLLKLGYIRPTRFIDKIHVCPVCRQSHLLFFECCPKCGSSDIREEPVLHHFRCANVSPESTYQWDGELRCPKCHHTLRHIGVDYDKPSSIFTCRQCDESFMYPDMRVICPEDRRTWTTDDLLPIDVTEYEFTPEGIRVFANYDIRYTLSQAGFYGYSSMRDFLAYLRMVSKAEAKQADLFVVARFYVFDPAMDNIVAQETTPPVVKAMSRFFNYKSALWGNNYYFLCRASNGELAQVQSRMEYELKNELKDFQQRHEGFEFELVDTYVYHQGEDMEQFIHRIEEDRN
ncbi:MAG: hypothetical protein K2O66_05075 [Bacteroidales bacterium]|nr:hypothetical protein [Bacteroidales bacterium]MDE7072714.1 hypothetical protein [Bacteroidales bacterium]